MTTEIRAEGWANYSGSEVRAALRRKGMAFITIHAPAGAIARVMVSKGAAREAVNETHIGRGRAIRASIVRVEREGTTTIGRHTPEGEHIYETHTRTIVSYNVIIAGYQPGL